MDAEYWSNTNNVILIKSTLFNNYYNNKDNNIPHLFL